MEEFFTAGFSPVDSSRGTKKSHKSTFKNGLCGISILHVTCLIDILLVDFLLRCYVAGNENGMSQLTLKTPAQL
ncbi:hypothetical protein EDS67_12755 [candidate division KSB1 bacterium]|nr:MAG: hypothetical protein EDS67_12755 [candidate division KSB1 bacterium]MBC6949317.1 hypothetical protein [candidate division KSB1 bacterium]MCE7944007.1 hypothetical protein [Chlorobi bacterium CHB1]